MRKTHANHARDHAPGGADPLPVEMHIKVSSDGTDLTVGDGQFILGVSKDMNGLDLLAVHANVTTVSSSGLPTVQIRNITDSVDMLSTKTTIDASEFNSYTAATPHVVSATNGGVTTGDRLAIDVDGAGTGAKGLGVFLKFGKRRPA